MDESSDELEQKVVAARSRLTQDLNSLEYQVRSSTDWRVQFGRHTWQVLGVAFAVGLLLGMRGMRH